MREVHMMSGETRRRALLVTALLLPVTLMKATSSFMGHGSPSGLRSVAAATSPPPPAVTKQRATPDQRQIEAARYAESLRRVPFGAAPLLLQPQSSNASPPQTQQEPSSAVGPVPPFTLGAIMASGANQRALINGRLYVLGESVQDTGWTVDRINSEERLVILREARTGRTVEVRVQAPR
jgi:hypothetical protein